MKKRFLFTLTFFIIVVAGLSYAYEGKVIIAKEPSAIYFALGKYHYNINDFDKALNYFQKAVEINQDFAEARHNLGVVYHKLNNYDNAIIELKEAIEKGDQEDAKIFESVDAANSALVKMEVEALNKVSEGDKESAIIILESDNYQDQKSIYQNGLNSYFSRRGSQTTSAIQTATIDVKLTTKNTTDLIKSSIRAIFIIFFLTIMSGVGIAYFTFRSISKPIMDTTNVVNEISMGNFTVKIFGMSKLNEINQLTQALNRIIKTMKLAVLEKEPIAKPKGISSQKVSKKNKKKDKIRSRKVDKKLLDEAYNEKALQEKGEKWASDITKKRSNKK